MKTVVCENCGRKVYADDSYIRDGRTICFVCIEKNR